MVKHEWSADELKHKAEAYCATAERCASEVTIKLQQWDATEQQIEDIVAHLKAQRYIDEERYKAIDRKCSTIRFLLVKSITTAKNNLNKTNSKPVC